jgi:penicillin-binding protein 2
VKKTGKIATAIPENTQGHFARLGILLLAILVILVFRVWVLQLVEGESYQNEAQINGVRSVVVKPLRGEILDRNGVLLATNKPTFDLMMDKMHYGRRIRARNLEIIAPLVGAATDVLLKKMRQQHNKEGEVVLYSNISYQLRARIEELQTDLPGVRIQEHPQRYYPHGKTAGHLVGYVQEISGDDLKMDRYSDGDYASGDLIGRSGLEYAGEDYLRGKKGLMKVRLYASGVQKSILSQEEKNVPGLMVQTHLDLDLQAYCEKILEITKGSIIVLSASGEVRAMASNPRMDPNAFVDPTYEGERASEFFSAIQGTWEPGSIYKMMVAYAGLREGLVSASETIYCGGGISRGGYKFSCLSKYHAKVDIYTALQKSCNVFFYTVGERLGKMKLKEYALLFGFGQTTGIEIPNEAVGIIPDPAWKKKHRTTAYHNYGHWVPGDTLHASIGQGMNKVTPLQIAQYTLTLANKGQRYQPRLLWRVLDHGQVVHEFEPQALSALPAESEEFEHIDEGLWRVVNKLGGTAYETRKKGIQVCGKSGSAEHASDQPTHAWFCGYAPRENPRYVVVVFFVATGHGGDYSAPPAMDIFERLLNDERTKAAD